tara:strand:- start:2510 stop:2653 length:144 start_codon:yes stop_codon:yes gene_type:complete
MILIDFLGEKAFYLLSWDGCRYAFITLPPNLGLSLPSGKGLRGLCLS